jgi:subtilisin family serine protease
MPQALDAAAAVGDDRIQSRRGRPGHARELDSRLVRAAPALVRHRRTAAALSALPRHDCDTFVAAVPGLSVTLDAPLTSLTETDDTSANDGSMYDTARQVGAKRYWTKGYTGRGVDIAVIDTGVSPVVGLAGGGKLVYGPDLSFEAPSPSLRNLDTYGHGTHMAGIIAGRDDGSYNLVESDTAFVGIAPDARIVSLKVANAMGATDVSQVIAALDWVVANGRRDGLNVRVINLSFGTDGVQHYTLDPLSYAVEQAWHAGYLVVVAAGNGGFGSAKLNNPAYNPFVLAVGATDTRGTMNLNDDIVPAFSSSGDKHRNPDIVAPGKSIVSLRVGGSQLDLSHPEGRVGQRFFKGSGTSQAAAIVSGAAALIIEQRPNIAPDQLKDLFNSNAVKLPGADPVAQGNGALHLGLIVNAATNRTAIQTWQPSTGTGSLDAARGSLHVTDPAGNELAGEVDIFGRPFDAGLWGNDCTPTNVEPEPTVEPEPEATPEPEPSEPSLSRRLSRSPPLSRTPSRLSNRSRRPRLSRSLSRRLSRSSPRNRSPSPPRSHSPSRPSTGAGGHA